MGSCHICPLRKVTKLECTHKSKVARFLFQGSLLYLKEIICECLREKKKSTAKWIVQVCKSELLLSHGACLLCFFFIFLQVEREVIRLGSNGGGASSSSSSRGGVGRHYGDAGGGAWKPALQSFSEIGTWKAPPPPLSLFQNPLRRCLPFPSLPRTTIKQQEHQQHIESVSTTAVLVQVLKLRD